MYKLKNKIILIYLGAKKKVKSCIEEITRIPLLDA